MNLKYEVKTSAKLGRYLVAAKDLKAGERIFTDQPFALGPSGDTALVCFNCYLPLINKFLVCKMCAVAPVCPGDGCPEEFAKWHNQYECEYFRALKLTKGINPMTLVQNVGSLLVLRVLLKKDTHAEEWKQFMELETHLDKRRESSVWEFYDNTVKFIQSLGLLDNGHNKDLVQHICAAIDVNSFEVRGPPIPAINCAEILRGVYLRGALLAHDCRATAHIAITDSNVLVCHASADIKKGDAIYYNYTDPLKGTAIRQQHLAIGKYFTCTCERCRDVTELGTHVSSARCSCGPGLVPPGDAWVCQGCGRSYGPELSHKVQCCADKLEVINKKDEKELEQYIKYVSLVLAPNHYLLLDAKQRLAGVLRDTINREPRPTKKLLRRKIELCNEILPVLETLSPGICRTKAITMYELHATKVQLAKKLLESREITGSQYMEELLNAEKLLKRALEMLVIEPGNSPEGELCAKALEEYRALKNMIAKVFDSLHAEGKSIDSFNEKMLEEEKEELHPDID